MWFVQKCPHLMTAQQLIHHFEPAWLSVEALTKKDLKFAVLIVFSVKCSKIRSDAASKVGKQQKNKVFFWGILNTCILIQFPFKYFGCKKTSESKQQNEWITEK